MNPENAMWGAVAAMWIACASAVSLAVYLTGSAWCLWGLMVPAMVSARVG